MTTLPPRHRTRLAALAALAATLSPLACGKTKEAVVQPTNAYADSSDQVMYGARSLLTDQGLLRAELHADTAYFFDENSRIEMRTVRTTFYTQTGAKNAVLTSRAGTYDQRRQQMTARGDVVVVGEDGRRLESQQLKYDQRMNQISSDSAFTVTEPGGRRLSGIGFISDPQMNNMRCLRACGGAAGQVILPESGPAGAAPPPDTARPALRPGDRPGSIRIP